MKIADRLARIGQTIPAGVTLVAVSKFHPVDALQEAYDCGQRVFGESRVQELMTKQPVLPADIEWQFLGPLLASKVR